MAELTVKFKTSGFSSAARSLGRSFDTRYNDYQGIRQKVRNENTSRSYLNSSGSYLQKKMDGLDSKRDKLKTFKTKMEDFCDDAKRVDKGVANRVKRDAKDIYKTLGIKTGFWATTAAFFKGAGKAIWNGLKDTWGAIKAGAKTVWEAVKEWYEKHKKVIKIIFDTLIAIVVLAAVILAIAATFGLVTGVLAVIGTALLAAKAAWDLTMLVGEVVARHAFHNEDMAQTLHKLSTNQLLKQLGKNLDEDYGLPHPIFECIFSGAGVVLDVLQIVNIWKVGSSIVSAVKAKDYITLTNIWKAWNGVSDIAEAAKISKTLANVIKIGIIAQNASYFIKIFDNRPMQYKFPFLFDLYEADSDADEVVPYYPFYQRRKIFGD